MDQSAANDPEPAPHRARRPEPGTGVPDQAVKGGTVVGLREEDAEAFQFVGSKEELTYLRQVLAQAGFEFHDPDPEGGEIPLLYRRRPEFVVGEYVEVVEEESIFYKGKRGYVQGTGQSLILQAGPKLIVFVRLAGGEEPLPFGAEQLKHVTPAPCVSENSP